MNTLFRPMLAVDHEEARLRFPYYASPKLDGIRCLVLDGVARTRSMKTFPNEYVDQWFREHADLLADMDGELIVGEPTAKDCYNQTASGLMRITGRPSFQFFVFDLVDRTGRRPFTDRAQEAQERLEGLKSIRLRRAISPDSSGEMVFSNVGWLLNEPVDTLADLRRMEDVVLDAGYEGVMLRAPSGRYKQGRATLGENTLLKVKRFRDAEAVIVGVEEQMHNANTAMRNELGRTKRSTAKAGLIGKDTAGALIVKGVPGQPFAGVSFGIGAGLDDELRARLWALRKELPGQIVKYRYFDIGVKDAPRHPVFIGFRVGGT